MIWRLLLLLFFQFRTAMYCSHRWVMYRIKNEVLPRMKWTQKKKKEKKLKAEARKKQQLSVHRIYSIFVIKWQILVWFYPKRIQYALTQSAKGYRLRHIHRQTIFCAYFRFYYDLVLCVCVCIMRGVRTCFSDFNQSILLIEWQKRNSSTIFTGAWIELSWVGFFTAAAAAALFVLFSFFLFSLIWFSFLSTYKIDSYMKPLPTMKENVTNVLIDSMVHWVFLSCEL